MTPGITGVCPLGSEQDFLGHREDLLAQQFPEAGRVLQSFESKRRTPFDSALSGPYPCFVGAIRIS